MFLTIYGCWHELILSPDGLKWNNINVSDLNYTEIAMAIKSLNIEFFIGINKWNGFHSVKMVFLILVEHGWKWNNNFYWIWAVKKHENNFCHGMKLKMEQIL